MRAYLFASSALFVLITLLHVARVVIEGVHTLADPVFAISSGIALFMSAWSARLLTR